MAGRMDFESAITATVTTMGLQPLKPKQMEAVQAFMSGNDVIVILPTGYGKSVIYAVLPLLADKLYGHNGSIVVILTPLIALMMDQKRRFQQKGVCVEFVGEAQNDDSAIGAVLNGEIQLVYISPESLLNNKKFRSMLLKDAYQEKLVALVVDEAHCIQMWGESFRKAFFEIGTVRSLLPKSINVMALTATATKQTVSFITEHLAMHNPVTIGLSSNRPNIRYVVQPAKGLHELSSMLADELVQERTKTPKTVVFCRTLSDCADLFSSIKAKLGPKMTEPPGLPNIIELRLITLFTSATTSETREEVLAVFREKNSILRLIIASSAFGLGVDIPDITRIINWGLPNTLEELVQETGRAGRDGSPAEAILYFRNTGKKASKFVKEYAANTSLCRRYLLFKDFMFCECGNETVTPCRCCDLCTPLCNCMQCVGD